MIDTSGADVYGAFSKHLNMGKKQATTHGGEYWTPCSFCHAGTDRFHVWPFRFDEGPQYWCRICGRYGDVIDFLKRLESFTFLEACEYLNITLEYGRSQFSPRKRSYSPNDDEPPPDKWQDAAARFAHECKAALWSDIGINALNWLRKRGISDEIIKRAGLGYNSANRFENKATWGIPHAEGKAIWLARGIVIPWHIDRQLWKLCVRRNGIDLKDDEKRGEKPRKYVAVKGGSSGIYGIDTFNPELPSVLVEGEFDRLILAQAEPDCINALATGSTDKGQGERWALTLAQAPATLIAFDADGGGQIAARDYWLKYLPHAFLWKPWAHDVNDMHIQGLDVVQWVFMGMTTADALLAS